MINVSKLRSFVVASLLFSSVSIYAEESLTIVTPSALPTLQEAKNLAKNEIIVVFKKDVKVFDEDEDKNTTSNFMQGMSHIVDPMKEFESKFKSKLENKFNKNHFEAHGFKHLNAMHMKSDENSTKELMEYFRSEEMSEYVESVSANNMFVPTGTTDSYYSKLWAIENTAQEINGKVGTADADMNVLEAWSKTKGESNVVVAVLDSGVDYRHSDLQDNMWNGAVNHGYDFAGDDDGNNDDDPIPDAPYDENGHYHGTHVAGIIGAVGDNANGVSGVAQHVSIMALKVFRPNGYGYTSDVLEALDYISTKIDEGENIVAVNASYGGLDGSQDDALNSAIKKLGEKGVLFCVAAGNESQDIDEIPSYPASYDAENIIAIAASDQDDKLADFSNYGVKSVDVAAPGTNILSTYPDNQYAYLQGTSMATPHVTGSVALLASLYADSTVAERKAMILNGVDKKDAFVGKVATEGRVNINNSLSEEEKNIAPSAKDDRVTTAYETAVSIDVLANDSDEDNDKLTLKSVGEAQNGSVKIENGKVLYTPNSEFSGEDSFEYTISDGEDTASSKVTVVVEEKANTAPVAQNDTAVTAYETAVTIDVLENDSDKDGDALTLKSVSDAQNGSVKIENGDVVYTPNSKFSGTDSFSYTISDGKEESSSNVTVTVKEEVKEDASKEIIDEVKEDVAEEIQEDVQEDVQEAIDTHLPINNAPIAKSDSIVVAFNQAVTIDVLKNDSDKEHNPLSITYVSQAKHGKVKLENGKITYRPNTDFSGTDSFSYTISDAKLTAEAMVFVKVKEEALLIDMNDEGEEQFYGKVKKGDKESTLVIDVKNRELKVDEEGNTHIDFKDKDLSIEIDNEGNMKANFSKLKKAVMPKDAFPLGTNLEMNEESMKFTTSVSKNIRF